MRSIRSDVVRPDSQLPRGERSAGVAARPRQPHLFDLRRPATDARLFTAGSVSSPTEADTKPMPSHRQGKPRRCRRCFRRRLRVRPLVSARRCSSRRRLARRLRRQLRLQRYGSARRLSTRAIRSSSPRRRPTLDVYPTGGGARPAVDRQHPRLRPTLPRVRRRADRHSRAGWRARPRRAGDRPDPPRAGRRRPARLRARSAPIPMPTRTALRRSGWCSRA